MFLQNISKFRPDSLIRHSSHNGNFHSQWRTIIKSRNVCIRSRRLFVLSNVGGDDNGGGVIMRIP